MNDKVKRQITELRIAGYSYGQIAKLLNMKRSTVSNYCLNNNIYGPDPPGIRREYKYCLNCHGIFTISSKREKQFCSDKCRKEYWCCKKAQEEDEDEIVKHQMTLKKELDFLAKESDELDGGNAWMIGFINQTESL